MHVYAVAHIWRQHIYDRMQVTWKGNAFIQFFLGRQRRTIQDFVCLFCLRRTWPLTKFNVVSTYAGLPFETSKVENTDKRILSFLC